MVARYFQMLPSNAKNKSVAMMATAAPEKIKRSIARTFEKIRSISNHMNIRRSRTERLLYQGAGSTMASVVAFIGPESQSQTDAGFDRSVEQEQQWSLQNPANGPKKRPSC